MRAHWPLSSEFQTLLLQPLLKISTWFLEFSVADTDSNCHLLQTYSAVCRAFPISVQPSSITLILRPKIIYALSRYALCWVNFQVWFGGYPIKLWLVGLIPREYVGDKFSREAMVAVVSYSMMRTVEQDLEALSFMDEVAK